MKDTTPQSWLADRALVRIAGEDVRGFLQGLVTSDLTTLTEGTPLWGGLLTPQGKALFDFLLWTEGDAVLLDVEDAAADALVRRLSLYRLRRPITIEKVPGRAVHWRAQSEGGTPDPRLPALGHRWLGFPEGDDASAAWRAHRLALGVAEGVGELGSGETLWLECNAAELGGVSYTKGCYIGQENTARMHYRSTVNRRLVVVPLAEGGTRVRARYPDLNLMVELRRVEALGDALRPEWLQAALVETQSG